MRDRLNVYKEGAPAASSAVPEVHQHMPVNDVADACGQQINSKRRVRQQHRAAALAAMEQGKLLKLPGKQWLTLLVQLLCIPNRQWGFEQ